MWGEKTRKARGWSDVEKETQAKTCVQNLPAR